MTLWNVRQNVNQTKKCPALYFDTQLSVRVSKFTGWLCVQIIDSFLSRRNQNSLAPFCPGEQKNHWWLICLGEPKTSLVAFCPGQQIYRCLKESSVAFCRGEPKSSAAFLSTHWHSVSWSQFVSNWRYQKTQIDFNIWI